MNKQEQIELLYMEEGMNAREIAEEVGSSIGSVQSTIYKFGLNKKRQSVKLDENEAWTEFSKGLNGYVDEGGFMRNDGTLDHMVMEEKFKSIARRLTNN